MQETDSKFGKYLYLYLSRHPDETGGGVTMEKMVDWRQMASRRLESVNPPRGKRGEYRVTPWWRLARLRRKLHRLTILLRVAWLYVSWPFRKRWARGSFVFAVYGNDRQQAKFFPKSLRKYMRGAFPIARMYFRGWKGFICATPRSESQLAENLELARGYLQAITREFPNTASFALAGRLPSWAYKAGGPLTEPFRDGSFGTRYAMLRVAERLAGLLNKETGEVVICVAGGAGYIGGLVVQDLSVRFKHVIALDKSYGSETVVNGNVTRTSRVESIHTAEAMIVLTGRGEDVADIIPHVPEGMVIADDTHPPIPERMLGELRDRGAVPLKAVVEAGKDGLIMKPNLPGFFENSIPGCLVHAIVEMVNNGSISRFDDFCQRADEVGFEARLITHPPLR